MVNPPQPVQRGMVQNPIGGSAVVPAHPVNQANGETFLFGDDLFGSSNQGLSLMTEIGPNQKSAMEEKSRQESSARREEARQKSAAEQEKSRQEANAKIEEARQRAAAKQIAQFHRTLRFAIGAFVSLAILFVTAFLLWLASTNAWPKEAMYVIGSLGGLSVIGGGVLTARQTRQEPEKEATAAE